MKVFNKIIGYTRLALTSELLSGSFFVFLGGTFSNFLAFILNIFFARSLTYADYGTYVALVSLFSLAIIPGQSMSTVIVRFATNFFSTGEMENFSAFYKKILKSLVLIGVVFLVLSFIFSSFIASFLNIKDVYLIIFTAVLVFINYILTLNIAYTTSILKFKELSISFVLSGTAKITAGVALVYMGLNVYGAMGSLFFLILIQMFYLVRLLRRHIDFNIRNIKLPLLDMFKYAAPTSIAILFLYSFVLSDVLLVKHFFNSYEAGLYGGLSLVGKVIFYFTLPIPAVLFPLVVKKQAKKEDHSRLLYMALILVAVPSILLTLFYFLLPTFTLKIFLGGADYLKVAPFLGLFGIFLTIYSINNVFVTYFLSIRKTFMSVFVLIFAVSQIVLAYKFHADFRQIIMVSTGTSMLLLASLILYYLKDSFPARS